MQRLFQYFALFSTACALVAVVAAPGCSDECGSVRDCEYGEVCYKGICTPNSNDYVRCGTDEDCDTTGQFICLAARCVLKQTGVADSGVAADALPTADALPAPDAMMGNPDAMSFPDAMGNPDAMDMDAGMADTGTTSMGGDM